MLSKCETPFFHLLFYDCFNLKQYFFLENDIDRERRDKIEVMSSDLVLRHSSLLPFFAILQIDSQFDVDEAKKCLYWIGEVTGENIEIQDTDDKREMAHSFYSTLRDGMLICKWVFTDDVPFLPPA